MENEEENATQDVSRKKYPVRDLRGILEFVAKIYTELGPSQYHSREQIAGKHNLEVASIKQTLSTAVQFGLLELKHGTGYKVTPLYVRIQKPLNEAERTASVVESLQQSEIFKHLIDDYKGHTIPSLSGITNNITRTFDLKDSIASKVADIFVKSLNDFNLTNVKGELVLKTDSKQKEQPNGDLPPPPQPPPPYNPDLTIEITVPLKNGKRAYIRLPDGYTDSDLRKISKFVDALRDDDDDKT